MCKSKEQNSAKNNWKRTTFQTNSRILVTDLYSEFQLMISMNDRDNKWKPLIIWIFSNQRGMNLPKIIPTEENSNFTCVFLWHI